MPILELSITEEERAVLERKALRDGTTVEALLRDYVEELLRAGTDEESVRGRDPLLRLAPVRGSGLGDLGRQHDHYLYGIPKK